MIKEVVVNTVRGSDLDDNMLEVKMVAYYKRGFVGFDVRRFKKELALFLLKKEYNISEEYFMEVFAEEII